MSHREQGLLAPSPSRKAPVQGFQVGTLHMAGPMSGFHEQFAEPGTAFACFSREALAGALMVAGAHAGPAGQVFGGRKARHINADLSQDALRRTLIDAWDRVKQLDRLFPSQGPCLAPLSRLL